MIVVDLVLVLLWVLKEANKVKKSVLSVHILTNILQSLSSSAVVTISEDQVIVNVSREVSSYLIIRFNVTHIGSSLY